MVKWNLFSQYPIFSRVIMLFNVLHYYTITHTITLNHLSPRGVQGEIPPKMCAQIGTVLGSKLHWLWLDLAHQMAANPWKLMKAVQSITFFSPNCPPVINYSGKDVWKWTPPMENLYSEWWMSLKTSLDQNIMNWENVNQGVINW